MANLNENGIIARRKKYLLSKGWYTMRSPNNWLNNIIMDDLSLDHCGVNFQEALKIQRIIDSNKFK